MFVINARELLQYAPLQILKVFNGPVTVTFEDNVTMEATAKKLMYSRYFWEFHVKYPKLPLTSKHYVDHILKGEPLDSNTHIKLLELIKKETRDVYGFYDPIHDTPLLFLTYDIVNNIWNEVLLEAEDSVVSIDLLDLLDCVDHPEIAAINRNTLPTDASIRDSYVQLHKVLKTSKDLDDNSLARAFRAKTVNANQINQVIGRRGFSTTVKGEILDEPVMTNYTEGMYKLYEFAAESISSAKFMHASEKPLEDSEYFARTLQLLAMVVERITYEDCGSTKYLDWLLQPPIKDSYGNTTYPGDLKFMQGKYYLDEKSGKLVQIQGDESHLYGQTIKLRSTRHCQTSDPKAVCHVCFGALSRNVAPHANLGHLCSVTLTQQTTQSTLGGKHLDSTSSSPGINLGQVLQQFFKVGSGRTTYILRPEYAQKQTKLTVSRDYIKDINSIFKARKIEEANHRRISSIEKLTVTYTQDMVTSPVVLDVSQGGNNPYFTPEFLEFIKETRWILDKNSNYVFDLQDWDFTKPILKLPEYEYSYADHSKQIESIIKFRRVSKSGKSDPTDTPTNLIYDLFTLVNKKLSVNLSCLEVIVYALCIRSDNDYRLSRGVDEPKLAALAKIISRRSLSNAYCYEETLKTIFSPASFSNYIRPDSNMDVLFAPHEVVEEMHR